MPQVSVILPNYNHSGFLDKRITSILNQAYQDFELIILDDCSTDNSREVIEKYRSHKKVSHIVYNDVNGGSTFSQWDKGILLAAGEFIWIAESDDYCEPVFLSELIPPLQQDRDLAIAFCQSLFVLPDGRVVNKTEAGSLARKVSGEEFLRKHMLGTNGIANASMAVFRKDVIASVSPEYKNYRYCGDWYFYASMCMKGNVFISGKYLNYYLRHENSVTNSSTKTGLDFFEGNKVFHFITSNIQVNQEDTRQALDQRITRYLQLKNEFQGSVRDNVLKSVLDLDPSARSLLRKRMAMAAFRRMLSAIRKKVFK